MTKSEEVRIGVTVPSLNSVVEAWYPRVVPEHVSVHFARMLMPSDATPECIIEMDRTDGVRSIRQSGELSAARHRLRLHRLEHRTRARI
jgi:maleate cis-trans isomerase